VIETSPVLRHVWCVAVPREFKPGDDTPCFAVAFLSACSGKKVLIGTSDEVRYSGSATQQEAEALGAALKASGYFQDHGAGVILSNGGDGSVISFAVKDGFWKT
jgi:hypothetical protein